MRIEDAFGPCRVVRNVNAEDDMNDLSPVRPFMDRVQNAEVCDEVLFIVGAESLACRRLIIESRNVHEFPAVIATTTQGLQERPPPICSLNLFPSAT